MFAGTLDVEGYGSICATLSDPIQSPRCDSLGFRKGAAAVNPGEVEVEFLEFAEQGALVHTQLSGCGQTIVAVALQGFPDNLLLSDPAEGLYLIA